jgi:hypothetical protein
MSLGDFCQFAFRALEVLEFIERESSNCVDGHYFRSVDHDPVIDIFYVDDQDFSDYRFWVSISASSLSAEAFALRTAATFAEFGYDGLVPSTGWARKNWDGSGVHFTA